MDRASRIWPMATRLRYPLRSAQIRLKWGNCVHILLNGILMGFNRCKSADRSSGYRPICVLKSAMGYHVISFRVPAVPAVPDSLTEGSTVRSVHAVMGAMHGSHKLSFDVLAADLDSDPNSQ